MFIYTHSHTQKNLKFFSNEDKDCVENRSTNFNMISKTNQFFFQLRDKTKREARPYKFIRTSVILLLM